MIIPLLSAGGGASGGGSYLQIIGHSLGGRTLTITQSDITLYSQTVPSGVMAVSFIIDKAGVYTVNVNGVGSYNVNVSSLSANYSVFIDNDTTGYSKAGGVRHIQKGLVSITRDGNPNNISLSGFRDISKMIVYSSEAGATPFSDGKYYVYAGQSTYGTEPYNYATVISLSVNNLQVVGGSANVQNVCIYYTVIEFY